MKKQTARMYMELSGNQKVICVVLYGFKQLKK